MYVWYGGAGAAIKSVMSLPDSCYRDGAKMWPMLVQGASREVAETTMS
jgi:hypothetical protein